MSAKTFRIGIIVRPHGVHGAVKCNPLTDEPKRFIGMKSAYLELHGSLVPVQLLVHSAQKDAVILSVDGYDTPEKANELRDVYICVERNDAIKLPAFTYFVADLIGCMACDTNGNQYGKLTDVLETGANDVYVIDGGKLMVPALKKVISKVDVDNAVIVFNADVLKEVGLFED
ncbi:MAG: ribosome maturation factor RimM [Eubacteriales bacterium]|nr:ribosome maturation factor RimM [Eubacteriales bacterium]